MELICAKNRSRSGPATVLPLCQGAGPVNRMECAVRHMILFMRGRCFLEYTHTDPCRDHDSRCKAITDLIESVAEEQEALARILEAEHKKIEKAVEMCGADAEDLIRVNKSVERVLAAVTRLELALQLKLALFDECLCPDRPCRGD